jgi:hypothetical protein
MATAALRHAARPGSDEVVVQTRTVLPSPGWYMAAEAAPTWLPPGFHAAHSLVGPDGDELRVRSWLRRRIGGVG